MFGKKKSYEELEAEKKELQEKKKYNQKRQEIKDLRKEAMNPARKKAAEIASESIKKVGNELREYRKRNRDRLKNN